jgi:hypothetical protein
MLEKVGKSQGIDIHTYIPPGTLLLIRSGWIKADFALSKKNVTACTRVWSGVQPSQEMPQLLWQQRGVDLSNLNTDCCFQAREAQ